MEGEGETHRRCLLRGCRRPPGAAPFGALRRRALSGGGWGCPAGPAASAQIGAQAQILLRGVGGRLPEKPLPAQTRAK